MPLIAARGAQPTAALMPRCAILPRCQRQPAMPPTLTAPELAPRRRYVLPAQKRSTLMPL